jgi:hypothetical protein
VATYERGAGDHIAERLRPVPGSDEEARLNTLADDPSTDWRRIDDEPLTPVTSDPPTPVVVDPKAPARSASKSDWFVYAVSRGLGEDEADKLTRDQLVELFLDGGNP